MPTTSTPSCSEREQLGSTAIGDGVAIPHCKLPRLDRVVVAVGHGPGGVAIRRRDGQPVRLFFLVVSPERARRPSTCRCLAAISRWLKGDRTSSASCAAARPATRSTSLPASDGVEETVAEHRRLRRGEPSSWARSFTTSTSRSSRARRHLDNRITHPRVQKPGLAFAGYYAYIKPGRVQIVGESETEYLQTLDAERAPASASSSITALPVPVFVITKGIDAAARLPRAPASEREVPVLSLDRAVLDRHQGRSATSSRTTWSPRPRVHGVLLEIYGLGVLLIGEQRRREERVGARPHHPRPQPGRPTTG